MRCISLYIILLLYLVFGLKSGGQEVKFSSNLMGISLPKEALRSKYRIRLAETTAGQLEATQNLAKEFTAKFRMTTYIIRKDGLILLDAGDYSEKKYARQRFDYLKKNYKKAKIVKSENDSISEFFIYEKKKPALNKTISALPDNKPSNKIEIKTIEVKPTDPPADRSTSWSDPKYNEANSAKDEDYLTDNEKKIYYYLNLLRMNPKLFADTYLGHLRNSSNQYESSLYSELQKIDPLPVLKPNRKLYESAKCHAIESGESGYLGHTRKKCTKYFMGECCQYGISNPLNIIISLLIDEGIPTLGHRKICLSPYTELGVSIQPHKSYCINTVMDFY
jgi:uncharacterized protein YkwD